MPNIGEKLKRARKEKGLTQQEMANKLGITQKNYSTRWERNDIVFQEKRIIKICEILDIDANYLFSITDNDKNMSISFKEQLMQARKEKGIYSYKMAEKLEMTQPSYCYFEHSSKPWIKQLHIICKTLGIDANYLYGLGPLVMKTPNSEIQHNKQQILAQLKECHKITEGLDNEEIKNKLYELIILEQKDSFSIIFKREAIEVNTYDDKNFVMLCCIVHSYILQMLEVIEKNLSFVPKLMCWYQFYTYLVEILRE